MNKKGQSLILFVLILPIIVFFLALFIDSSMMYLLKSREKGIIKDNMQMALNNDIRDKDKIIRVIKENDVDLNVNVIINENDIRINIKKENEGIFSKLFKLDVYNIDINYCGNYHDKKIREC